MPFKSNLENACWPNHTIIIKNTTSKSQGLEHKRRFYELRSFSISIVGGLFFAHRISFLNPRNQVIREIRDYISSRFVCAL